MPRFIFVAAVLVAFLWPSAVGAAERPKAEPVEIARVTGDAGWYVVKLADGRVIGLTPPRSRKKLIAAPQVGKAMLTSTTLVQGNYTYLRVKR